MNDGVQCCRVLRHQCSMQRSAGRCCGWQLAACLAVTHSKHVSRPAMDIHPIEVTDVTYGKVSVAHM